MVEYIHREDQVWWGMLSRYSEVVLHKILFYIVSIKKNTKSSDVVKIIVLGWVLDLGDLFKHLVGRVYTPSSQYCQWGD